MQIHTTLMAGYVTDPFCHSVNYTIGTLSAITVTNMTTTT